MIDLKKVGAGKQVIKQILQNSKTHNQPWSKEHKQELVKTRKNSQSSNSRFSK